MPDARQITGQGVNARPVVRSERAAVRRRGASIVLFRVGQPGQLGVPLAFQRVGDEPMFGAHEHELPLRQLRVLTRPLDLRAPEAIDLGLPCAEFIEHLERDLQGGRCDRLQHDLRSEEHTLNSSHVRISYAVFCLKKKKKNKKNPSKKKKKKPKKKKKQKQLKK